MTLATCQHSKHTRLMVFLLRQLGSRSANLETFLHNNKTCKYMKTKPTFTTIMARAAMTLFLSLLTTATTWAADLITDVMVIGGTQSEVNTLMSTYTELGWKVIDQDLNKGCGSKSDYVYLLYKTASHDDADATFITDFYISTASGTPPEGIISNNRTYTLTPYDGGSHFKSVKGDLNSNAKGSDIHLYYTKSNYDNSAVKSITFNNTKSGAVGENGGTTGCDLNKGAGGDYIYMHTQYSEGWIITKNVTGDQCYIDGFEGPIAMITNITIPYYIDNATVIGIRMNFSAFKNLETMNFYRTTPIDWMPSVKGCSKFKNVNQLKPEGSIYKSNTLPDGITHVSGYAFAGTAIKTLSMPKVTEVGDNAFEGCDSLTSVTFGTAATIGIYAFSKINNKTKSGSQTTYNRTTITYPGPLSDWDWRSYEYSPNLVIKCKNGFCGWCGDEYNGSTMYKDACLYWVLKGNDLTIDCIPLDDFFENHGTSQVIKTKNWDSQSVKSLSLNHVYTIGENAFNGYNNLGTVSIGNSVTSIENNAFSGCNNLKTVTINSDSILSKAYTENSSLKNIFGFQVENYNIGNGVTGIGNYAFYGCTKLETVIIPNSVSSIGKYAFSSCNNLSDIYFDGTETRWGKVTKGDDWKPDGTMVHWRSTVTFDANGHGTAPSAQTNLWSNQGNVADPGALTASGYDFIGWYADAACTTPWNFNNDIVPGDMTLYAYWIEKHDLLANAGNGQNLAGWNGTACTVQLKGSTIYKDYRWYTLCLPFSLGSLNGTPLEGLTLMELDGTKSHFKNDTLTLNFTTADNIEAGKPYLVRDNLFRFPIASKADWDAFTARVNAGEKTLHAKLVADITEPVTTMVNYYEGVFDGHGHTLTIAYGTEATPMDMEGAAPFVEIDKATIKNLNVKGDIHTSGINGGGLVGRMIDGCHVESCNVGVAIHSTVVGAGQHGGFVGWVDGTENVIANSAFTGSLLGPSTTHCGGFIGKNDRAKEMGVDGKGNIIISRMPISIKNCYFNPYNITIDTLGSYTFSQLITTIYNDSESNKSNRLVNVDITNCFYTRVFGEEQGTSTSATGSDLVALLGDAWEVRDGQVVPKIVDVSDDIATPIFRYVTIDATAPTGVFTADSAACFIGSYDPMDITGVDRTTLFLGGDNKLHYPNAAMTINAFKGWFQLAHALTDSSTGDVNGDKVLSVTDVAYIVSHILGTDNDGFVIANADVTGDGEISVNDVAALVNIILRGSNAFTVVTNLDDIPITFYGGGSGTVR